MLLPGTEFHLESCYLFVACQAQRLTVVFLGSSAADVTTAVMRFPIHFESGPAPLATVVCREQNSPSLCSGKQPAGISHSGLRVAWDLTGEIRCLSVLVFSLNRQHLCVTVIYLSLQRFGPSFPLEVFPTQFPFADLL